MEEQAISYIRQRPIILALDECPRVAETEKAIDQLQTGKAPGADGIPPEIQKMGGLALIEHLTGIFQSFWRKGELPQDLKDANIMHLYMNKGDKSVCDNHRDISLLSIAGKILARVLLNRIIEHLVDSVVSESQCGFRKNRGTIDMILQSDSYKRNVSNSIKICTCYSSDLTKTFDTVSRPGLWSIFAKLGCPPNFIRMVRSFNDGMMARVLHDGVVSEPFPVTNGVKQGCVLAPTLFSLLFAEMLPSALANTDVGIRIRYRTDGYFFDRLQRLKANTKVHEALIRNFIFADDCALAVHSESELQYLATCFSSAAKAFDLTVSFQKPVVVHHTIRFDKYRIFRVLIKTEKL